MADLTEVTEAPRDAGVPAQPRRRRLSVPMIIAAAIMFLTIASYFANGLQLLLNLGIFKNRVGGVAVLAGALTPEGERLVLAIFYLFLGALALLFLTGFLLKFKWGWSAAMTWTALGLAMNLVGYFRGEPRYLSMLGCVVLLLVLNQASLHREFHVGER